MMIQRMICSMPVKITGDTAVSTRIRNIADRTTRASRRRLDQAGEMIADRASDYAPVDRHNLEAAIQSEGVIGDNRRKEVVVSAGGIVNGVNVDRYATIMHESVYEPGKESKEKAERLGVTVGRKYLERAADDLEDEIIDMMTEAVEDLL